MKYVPFLLLFLVVSCASTEIFERADGTFNLIAHSYSESHAFSAAREEGQKHCAKLGKRFVLVDQKAQYQGLDKNVKAGLGFAGALLNSQTSPQNQTIHSDGSSHDDYRVEITFTCK